MGDKTNDTNVYYNCATLEGESTHTRQPSYVMKFDMIVKRC